MSYKCEICEEEFDTQEEADTCCVVCGTCGLYYFEYEIDFNGNCGCCAEELEEEENNS